MPRPTREHVENLETALKSCIRHIARLKADPNNPALGNFEIGVQRNLYACQWTADREPWEQVWADAMKRYRKADAA